MTRKNRNNLFVLAGLMLGVTVALPSAQAANITLTEPLQPGDYISSVAWNGGSGGTYREAVVLAIRPSDTGGTLLYNSGYPADSNDNHVGFSFNQSNGDLYYMSGFSGGDKGLELRVIRAGQTTSTLLISDMRSVSGRTIRSIAAADDGTVYAVQHDGIIRRFTPTAPNADTYTPGTNWKTLGVSVAQRVDLNLSKDGGHLLLADGNRSGSAAYTSRIYSISTATAATVTTLTSTGNSDIGSGDAPFSGAVDVAIDYANGVDGNGNLRLLVLNNSYLIAGDVPGSPNNKKRITELAFNPTTGVLSNPYSDGSGNVPGLSIAMSDLVRTDGGNAIGAMAFDNAGNLLVNLVEFSATYRANLFTQAQIDSHNTNLQLLSGDTLPRQWSSAAGPAGSFSAVSDFDIAPLPIPEPATLGLMALGGVMMTFRGRR